MLEDAVHMKKNKDPTRMECRIRISTNRKAEPDYDTIFSEMRTG